MLAGVDYPPPYEDNDQIVYEQIEYAPELLALLSGVMLDEEQFYDSRLDEFCTLSQFLDNRNGWRNGTFLSFYFPEFAVVDLDGDGIPEVILSMAQGEFLQFYLILHYQEGQVVSYQLSNRQFRGVDTAGAFWASGGGGSGGLYTMVFTESGIEKIEIYSHDLHSESSGIESYYSVSGQQTTYEEYLRVRIEFGRRTPTMFYEYSNQNVALFFSR
jgi:hypothetical protein